MKYIDPILITVFCMGAAILGAAVCDWFNKWRAN